MDELWLCGAGQVAAGLLAQSTAPPPQNPFVFGLVMVIGLLFYWMVLRPEN